MLLYVSKRASHTHATVHGMLSSLAQTIGLGSTVPKRPTPLLAVLLFWAPGKESAQNLYRAEVTLGACLDLVKKRGDFFRLQSNWKQPEHICHRWATNAQACQLNSQRFFCWLFFVPDAAPDLAITVSASLEELGVVNSARV